MAHQAVWMLGGVVAFLVTLVVSGIGGCNIHELGHLMAGRAAGVPVNDVIWCAPGNGRVVFAYQEPAAVSYAGGLLAAIVLSGVYWMLIRPRLRSFPWWMAGTAVMGTAISQVIVAILEGSSPERYAGLQDNTAGLAVVLVGPLLSVAAVQLSIIRPDGPRPEPT